MKKGLLKNDKMGKYELEQGFASYRTIIERFVGDIVICNNIIEVDPESIYDNMNSNGYYYVDENGEYRTKEEYDSDETGTIEIRQKDIYQFYLCNLNNCDKEFLESAGIILSYSDMLDCDVLCVGHCGTNWDYVLTNVKLFDNYEDLKKYEESEEF